jgi:SAM-dependent methyltransferase
MSAGDRPYSESFVPGGKDPLGQAVLDFLDGVRGAKVTVSCNLADDDVLPVRYLFRSFPELPEREVKALELCRGRVLDIGAGTGVHSLVLQERGFRVKAIDISPGAVEVMKIRGVREVVQENIFRLEGEKFDTLLMLMNGIGITETLDGLDHFLQHAKKLLNPGGQVLLESSDILYIYEEEDGSVLLDLNGDYYGQVEYRMAYKDLEGEPFRWLFIDFLTLQDHAEALGYICESVLEDDQGHYLAQLTLKEEIVANSYGGVRV